LIDFLSAENQYWSSVSNEMQHKARNNSISQSNYILSSSNILFSKSLSYLINENQSNYINATSNILMAMFNAYSMSNSNYIISACNDILMLGKANYNSNYAMTLSNMIASQGILNMSNYILSTSNDIIHPFTLLDVEQSNYTKHTSNNYINRLFTYNSDTSNYVILTSNMHATYYANVYNISNYISYTSNILTNMITKSFDESVGEPIIDHMNRWLEPNSYITDSTIDNLPFNYIVYKDGNVGIGVTYPTATLDIFTADTSNSIKVNSSIWAQSALLYSSDMRIKKNIIDIDDNQALAQILAIEPKIYDYIEKDNKNVYGFIAQQVASVIPNAITIQTEAIPNIFCLGSIYQHTLMINNEMQEPLNENDIIVIIYNNEKHIVKIDGIYSDNVYNIDNIHNITGVVFVYGILVNDFHTVDKNYIYTLNVCATQDLHRLQQNLVLKIEELKKKYGITDINVILDKLNKNDINTCINNSNLLQSAYDNTFGVYENIKMIQGNYIDIVKNLDITTLNDQIKALKDNNEKLKQDNNIIANNNSNLSIKVKDISGKIETLREVLQRNNII